MSARDDLKVHRMVRGLELGAVFGDERREWSEGMGEGITSV